MSVVRVTLTTVLLAAALHGAADASAADAVIAQANPGGQPLLLDAEPPLSNSGHGSLTPGQLAKLRQARAMRETGQLDGARELLDALHREAPHHPLILTELAQLMVLTEDFAGVVRVARKERWSQKDSLLLGRELAFAYERLGRLKSAVQTVLEVWIAAPGMDVWASSTLLRLHPAHPEGTVQMMRRAHQKHPARADLARTLARLEWRQGNLDAMLSALRAADSKGTRPPLRWGFAEELLRSHVENDSTAALETLIDLAADRDVDMAYRSPASKRAWAVLLARGEAREGAARVTQALRDMEPRQWDLPFLVEIARHLREGGRTSEARRLIEPFADRAALLPELAIEHALADLRDGPPERAFEELATAARTSSEGRFYLAEALFFAGMSDSALVLFQVVAQDPRDRYAGAALERIYLLEDARPRSALPVFGRIAYEEWRGETRRAMALTDSLYRDLPRNEMWAQAAVLLAGQLETLGEHEPALAPLLALADSLPSARLASLARERAGDIYLDRLQDGARALEQYEECLARYPRAWNAPEVRRKLQTLRRERRF